MNLYRKALLISVVVYLLLTMILLGNTALSLKTHFSDESQIFESSARQVLADETLSKEVAIKWLKSHSPVSRLLISHSESEAPMVDLTHRGSNEALWVIEDWLSQQANVEFSVADYEITYTPEIEPHLIRSLLNTAAAILASMLVLIVCFILIRRKVWLHIDKNIQHLNGLFETMLNNPHTVQVPRKLAPEFANMLPKLEQIQEQIVEPLERLRLELPALKQEAYNDPLTHMPNKRIFVKDLHLRVAEEEEQAGNGIVAIIRATTLEHINKTQGYQAGDNYLKSLGEIVKQTAASYPQAQAYRISGSDFALILDRVSEQSAPGVAENLRSQFSGFMRETELESIAHIGMAPYTTSDTVGDLLSYCDNAQSIAQTKGVNGWYLEKPSSSNRPLSKQNWKELLEHTLGGQRLALYGQFIKPIRGDIKSYIELQSRFKNAEGEFIPTQSLISQAEVLDYYIDIDKMVVEAAFEVAKTPQGLKETYGVNLSNRSALDVHFVIWLERLLLREPAVARRLVFEVSEHGLHADIKACRRFADAVHRAGSRYTIEHFGSSMLSFKYFREMNPDYVKLDGSHTRDVEGDTKLQYFIRLLVDVTHRMGVKVIAEAVETQEQKQLLEMLNIDAIQGYFVGRPAPVDTL